MRWMQATGLKRVTHEPRDLFRRPLLPAELAKYDAAVIDPPRAGAEAQATALAACAIGRISALSCSPATFARDAKILVDGGYRLDWVQMVDQFRFSPHVELAAQFTR
jgi:23S rRNA (uracil1939-C5)-methyltransferase